MSETPIKTHPLVALRINHKNAYDAVAMLFYLILVYGWGLWIYPLGRDYRHLATLGKDMPPLVHRLFSAEVQFFDANPAGYHAVNMLVMYGCMLLVYHFVNLTVRGLWWFGTLAACLFMANPVHSEAMHNLSGVSDLVPCLAGLFILTVYAWHASIARSGKSLILLLAAICIGAPFAENKALGLVLLVYEFLAVRKELRLIRRAVSAAGILFVLGGGAQTSAPYNPAQMFAPLYLNFYPIGFLPKTVEAFHARPWTGWLAAIAVAIVIVLIHRKAKRPIFLFAVIGMLLLRILPTGEPVDLVHMIGGGQLLLSNVLFVLGLVVVVFRIMDHPRWRVPMITMTTTLVIVMFALQWRSINTWSEASAFVRGFQTRAIPATQDGEPLGVLPDFQYFRGTPVCLSDAIANDSPFSRRCNPISILPIHCGSLSLENAKIIRWDENGGEIVVPAAQEAPLYAAFPNAGRIALGVPVDAQIVWGKRMPEETITVSRSGNELHVVIQGESLPQKLLPGNVPGKEPDGNPEPNADH